MNSFDNPYTYTGRRLDDETGLYYYRNRYYHANLGRFVSRDPIGYATDTVPTGRFMDITSLLGDGQPAFDAELHCLAASDSRYLGRCFAGLLCRVGSMMLDVLAALAARLV